MIAVERVRRMAVVLLSLASAGAAWTACAIYDKSLLTAAPPGDGGASDGDPDAPAPPSDAPAEDGCAPGFARCGSGACKIQLEVDPKNCGACGHDCLGAACIAATCQPQVVASGQGGPAYVAVENGVVYWTNASAGTLMRANVDGTGRATIARGLGTPWVLRASGGRVYVANDSTGGSVTARDGDGGLAVDLSGPQASPRGLDVTSQYVFFGTEDPDAGSIQRVGVDGTGLTVLVPKTFGTKDVVTDGVNVYWAAFGAGRIEKVPIAGGPAAVVTKTIGPFGLAVFSNLVFYTNHVPYDAGGSVGRVNDDGTGDSILAPGDNPRAIAVDGNYAYWTNDGDGTVARVPVGGGAVTTLATGQTQPWGIALDDKFVYWCAKGAGLVLRVAK